LGLEQSLDFSRDMNNFTYHLRYTYLWKPHKIINKSYSSVIVEGQMRSCDEKKGMMIQFTTSNPKDY
jgi:hypothetical protein